MTKLEQIARAVQMVAFDFSFLAPAMSDEELLANDWEAHSEIYLAQARAALQAMREPTMRMIYAAIGPMASHDEEQAGRTWQAMIYAILEESDDQA